MALLTAVLAVTAHTWLFSNGRASMEASTDFPFRVRKDTAGQGTHAQLGPGQEMVVRWASSHRNFYYFAIISAMDESRLSDGNYYAKLDDYIRRAPAGANIASATPRYHGKAGSPSGYIDNNLRACANGACANCFTHRLQPSDPAYVSHYNDMSGLRGGSSFSGTHYQYAYDPIYRVNDSAVYYTSALYPWIVGVHRYENWVNMHSDWDLVRMRVPAQPGKGHHYIVHYSSRHTNDHRYVDAIDVHTHPTAVPEHLIYGETTGDYGWTKIDNCQFIEPVDIVTPLRNATESVAQCVADVEAVNARMNTNSARRVGINVVPAANADVVPGSVVRSIEDLPRECQVQCAGGASGSCRRMSGALALCAAPVAQTTVAWANPSVSGSTYDAALSVMLGDRLWFTWEETTYHDVWLLPDATAFAACNFSAATQLQAGSNGGQYQYVVPEAAAGETLYFGCAVSSHCASGQKLSVSVGMSGSSSGSVCADGFTLCPDNSQQAQVGQTVSTAENVPWTHPRGASGSLMRLATTATRASTPWNTSAGWTGAQRHGGRKCAVLSSVRSMWDLGVTTLREAVERCSTNYPDECSGISWRRGAADDDVTDVTDDAVYVDTSTHSFRRCLLSRDDVKIVRLGQSTLIGRKSNGEDVLRRPPGPAEPEGGPNATMTFACPGCYQCRQLAEDRPYYMRYDLRFDFIQPRSIGTNVTVSMLQPAFQDPRCWGGTSNRECNQYSNEMPGRGNYLGWDSLTLVCMIDPEVAPPIAAETDLVDDPEWVTWLKPNGTMTPLTLGFLPSPGTSNSLTLGLACTPRISHGPRSNACWQATWHDRQRIRCAGRLHHLLR